MPDAQAPNPQGRKLDGCIVRERHKKATRRAGKNATEQTLTTTVLGIRELPRDWWNELGGSSAANSRSFQPRLVHATVVLRWDGAPKDAENLLFRQA